MREDTLRRRPNAEAKSLFRSILSISPDASIFCSDPLTLNPRKSFGTSNLGVTAQKMFDPNIHLVQASVGQTETATRPGRFTHVASRFLAGYKLIKHI